MGLVSCLLAMANLFAGRVTMLTSAACLSNLLHMDKTSTFASLGLYNSCAAGRGS